MLEAELDVIMPRENAMQAFQKLAQMDISQIPVVQNRELIGMFRGRDVLRWL